MSQRRILHTQSPPLEPITGRVMRHLTVTFLMAAGIATVFTAWTPASLDPEELAGQLAAALEEESGIPPALSASDGLVSEDGRLRIGIVAGHSGLYPDTGAPDPGSICEDGLTEAQVNAEIANLTVKYLEAAGMQVDLLEEWDPRLDGYRAVALVSIHADSCLPINEYATGYKVAAAVDTVVQDKAQRLVACLVNRYGDATDLYYHSGSITRDMTEYHTFQEVHAQTPAAIIETGFLYLDRDFLTGSPDLAARGIADGILCYVNNEPIDLSSEN
jgi:N-acetylmuramoyl-L-alanine amidase